MLITYLFISMSAHCSGHIFRDNKNLISKFLSSRFFEDLPLKKNYFLEFNDYTLPCIPWPIWQEKHPKPIKLE